MLGGTGTVTVTAGAGCNWTANSNANWITVTSGASGTGNGAVAFSVGPNAGAARTGTVSIAGQTFTVTQAAFVCTYSINPTSLTVPTAGGNGNASCVRRHRVRVDGAQRGGWIKMTSGSSGNGNGTVTFIVEDHNGKGDAGPAH